MKRILYSRFFKDQLYYFISFNDKKHMWLMNNALSITEEMKQDYFTLCAKISYHSRYVYVANFTPKDVVRVHKKRFYYGRQIYLCELSTGFFLWFYICDLISFIILIDKFEYVNYLKNNKYLFF